MEISSITASVPKPPSSLPLSYSSPRFLADNATSAAFLTRNKANTGALVLGGSRRGTGFRTEPARKGLTCNALFGLGVPELVVIAGVAALVFGPKKLPEVGRSIGKTIKSFQQAAKEFETELKAPIPESTAEAPADKPTAVIEEEKKDVTVPSSKENV
ncbi:hypothetical protein TIFTF001_000961 [Ficus carica]|uniref:Sec-independent protein translocase protein TATA, chloroplastic n=1 Tax=Ficus carica TaxID=3494 RepID=A0AA87ZDD0_FICCA|nr:hypothetical protein TIFTF001_000961 [Ficus carica]